MSSLFFICQFHPGEPTGQIGRNAQETGCVDEHCGEDDGTHGNAKACCALGEKTFESYRSCGVENGICGQEIVAAAFGYGEEDKWADVEGAEQAESGDSQERDEAGDGERKGEEREFDLVGVVAVGAALANVTGVDEVLHLQGDEVVAGKPDEIGGGDDGSGERAVPEPPATQMMALRWQDDKGDEQADDRECD